MDESLNESIDTSQVETPTKRKDSESGTPTKRPPSPAPYALHTDENQTPTTPTTNNEPKSQSTTTTPVLKSALNTQSKQPLANKVTLPGSILRAPYSQPVLDASKQENRRSNASVDDRLASARERRLQQQKIFGTDSNEESELAAKLERENHMQAKWSQAQEEKRRLLEEKSQRGDAARKEVEARKQQLLAESQKRAKAIVEKTEQQVIMRKNNRSASTDRTKRWSWGAGASPGYSPGMFSLVGNPSSPFKYYDPTKLGKKDVSNIGNHDHARPRSMYMSMQNLHQTPAHPESQSSTRQSSDKFSKSSLTLSTAHMNFASGLRNYDGEHSPRGGSNNTPSPARSRRSASTDSRKTKSKTSESVKSLPNTRGRSPAARRPLLQNNETTMKGRGNTTSLTEPCSISPRLLAPTRASLARSRQNIHENDDASVSSTGSATTKSSLVPMRSRSTDRRKRTTTVPKSASAEQKPSPKPATKRSVTPQRTSKPPSPRRAPSPATSANSEPPKTTKRLPSPAPKPKTNESSNQNTSKRNASLQVAKAGTSTPNQKAPKAVSTPPVIKQSLRTTTPKATTPKSAINKKAIDKTKTSVTKDAKKTVVQAKPQKPVAAKQPVKKPSTSATVDAKLEKKPQDVSKETKPVTVQPTETKSTDKVVENITDVSSSAEVKPVDLSSSVVQEMKSQDGTTELNKQLKQEAEAPATEEDDAVENTLLPNAETEKLDQAKNNEALVSAPVEIENENVVLQADEEMVDEDSIDQESISDKDSLGDAEQTGTDLQSELEAAQKSEEAPQAVKEHDNTKEDDSVVIKAPGDTMEQDVNEDVHQVDIPAVIPEPDAEPDKEENGDEDVQGEDEQVQESIDMVAQISNLEKDVEVNTVVETSNDVQPPTSDVIEVSEPAENVKESEDFPVIQQPVDKVADTTKDAEVGPVVQAEDQIGEVSQEVEDAPEVTEQKDSQTEKDTAEINISIVDEQVNMDSVNEAVNKAIECGENEDTCTESVDKDAKEQAESEEASVVQDRDQEEEKLLQDLNDKEKENQPPAVDNVNEPKLEADIEPPKTETEEQKVETPITQSKSEETVSTPLVEVADTSTKDKSTPAKESIPSSKSEETIASAPPANKKKEKKLTPEEEAYKIAIAEKRREAKEKREQEERERKERMKLQAEEQARREEEARRMFNEAQREREEEEKRAKEEEERKLKEEQEAIQRQKELAEQKVRDEAENRKKEREQLKQKQEAERLARKKRLEMIMRRTRQSGQSPTSNGTSNSQSPVGDASPRQPSPVSFTQSSEIGNSVSEMNTTQEISPDNSTSEQVSLQQDVEEININGGSRENSENMNGQSRENVKPPFEAFVHEENNRDISQDPFSILDAEVASFSTHNLEVSNDDLKQKNKLFEEQSNVVTGDLLGI